MGCTHNCESCSSGCGEPESFIKRPHDLSTIRHVIGVVSGKGGVGKSLVTSMLAVGLRRRGFSVGILDADITGPSIPKAFGLHDRLTGSSQGMIPSRTVSGIDVVSINLILEHEDDPVIYRGPILAQTVQQFWQEVIWQDIDFLFVDMPPGTGDVPLTVFQSIPMDGILIMTSPQDLVGMIVSKAVKMSELMHIPVFGLIENYSYLACPDCGKHISVFGPSHVEEAAAAHHLDVLAKLPLDPALAEAVDKGLIEKAELPESLDAAMDVLAKLEETGK